jgi:anti-sigma B factor antagonist
MSPTNLIINVRQISPKVSIIDIQGDLSASAEPALTNAYTQASGPTTRVIVINFSELAYMNSSGIGLLVTLLIRVNRQKQRLLCYGLSEHYLHIFALTRLSDVIPLYSTEQETLDAAKVL